MVLLLIFLFLSFLISAEYIIHKNFVSPFMLLLLSVLMAVCMFLWNLDNWELDLNYTFVLYLFTAILSFGAACFLVDADRKSVV